MTSRIHGLCLLLLAGCVPKGQYELVDVQLEATRTALNASGVRCREDLQLSEDKASACAAEVESRQTQLDALTLELEAVRAELTELHTAEAVRLATAVPEPAPEPTPKPKPGAKVPEPEPEIAPPEPPRELTEALDLVSEQAIRRGLLDQRHAKVEVLFAPLAEKGVTVRQIPGGSVVTIPVSKLYNEERMTLSPLGNAILEQTAAALTALPGHQLEVRGHTDARAFHSAEYASNWELGFAWAMGAMRDLDDRGIPMKPTASSFADTEPFADSETPESRKLNRRIELVLTVDPNLTTRFAPTPPEEPAPE